jgi:hypothetical protein
MTEKVDPITNEHVLEIRYRPNPRILDLRGGWADKISTEMGLKHWRIVENRVDVFADEQTEHAFVGFRNAGFTASDTPTRNFFPDKASKLLRFLFTLDAFGDELHVERLGIRSRFCTPFSGNFETLVELFASRYVTLTPAARAAIGAGARLIDIGAPLNFADRLGNFNTVCGPMIKKQLGEFFRKDEGFPEVGLYYDIDYFSKPERMMAGRDMLATINGCALAAWDRHERVKALILGA